MREWCNFRVHVMVKKNGGQKHHTGIKSKNKQNKKPSNQLHLLGSIWTPVSMSLLQGALQRVGFICCCDLCTHAQKCYLSPDLFVYQECKFMEGVPNLFCLCIYEHISVVMN